MSNKDFWDNLLNKTGNDEDVQGMFDSAPDTVSSYLTDRVAGAVEARMEGRKLEQGQYTSMQELTQSYRDKHAVQLPIAAGTQVQFTADPTAVFAYDDPPEPKAIGTVVEAKAASGVTTSYNDHVFATWPDGVTRAVHVSHLTLSSGHAKRGGAVNHIRVASLDSLLGEFLKVSEDKLVNRATRDLWSLRKEGEEYVIERLFDDEGAPIQA